MFGFGQAPELLALSKSVGPEGSVYGLERSYRRMAELREGFGADTNIKLLRGDAYSVPLPDGRVDYVVFKGVLHEVANPPKALREARRVCRTGGSIAVIDFTAFPRTWLRRSNLAWRLTRPWRIAGPPPDCHPGFSESEIRLFFKGAGLRVERFQADFADGSFLGTRFRCSARLHPDRKKAAVSNGEEPNTNQLDRRSDFGSGNQNRGPIRHALVRP